VSLFSYVTEQNKRMAVPLMGSVGARLSGKQPELCLENVELHFQALKALEDVFSPDILFPIMDLTLEAEALGLPIMYLEGVPAVAEHPVISSGDIAELKGRDLLSRGRIPLFIELAKKMKEITNSLVGAYVIGPFTLAAELVGTEELAVRIILDVDFIREILEFTSEVVSLYAAALAKRVDLVMILEPTPVILSPYHFAVYVNPLLAKLSDVIRNSGAFPVLHICGDATHLLDEMPGSGVDGFSLDSPVDLKEAALKMGKKHVVIGNIATVEVMLEKNAEEVRNTCNNLLRKMEGVPNFILATGCDLPPRTPEKNIRTFLESSLQY